MIAAVVVVMASLVNSVPATSAQTATKKFDMMSSAATSSHSQHVKPEHHSLFASESHSGQSNNGGSLLESGLSGLLEAISIPKKIVSSLVGKVFGLLKSINLKGLIKIALVGGAVVLLGAVAAAGAAGIAAVVALVSAALPYFRFFFGGHKGEASDSEMDNISEFVLSAFNKYDSQHKV